MCSAALRNAFETSDTYEDALESITNSKFATAAIYLLASRDEAAVIEHTGSNAYVFRKDEGPIAASNDYLALRLQHIDFGDVDFELAQNCAQRRECALQRAASNDNTSIESLIHTLSVYPAKNQYTAQQMAFLPSTGEYYAFYHSIDDAVTELF